MGTEDRAGFAGKIAEVAEFVNEHLDELTYDFWEKGADLRDLWRPGGGASKLTFRLLQEIIDRLPPESATKTKIRDNMPADKVLEMMAQPSDPSKYGPVSRTDSKIIDLIDTVRELGYIIQMVNTDKKGASKLKPPKPYPRFGGESTSQAIKKTRQLRMVQEMRRDRGATGGGRVVSTRYKNVTENKEGGGQ